MGKIYEIKMELKLNKEQKEREQWLQGELKKSKLRLANLIYETEMIKLRIREAQWKNMILRAVMFLLLGLITGLMIIKLIIGG